MGGLYYYEFNFENNFEEKNYENIKKIINGYTVDGTVVFAIELRLGATPNRKIFSRRNRSNAGIGFNGLPYGRVLE